tara:strand:+ start:860 stop:1729 length:870 start_codon:yes stop_codon:yes gene_type:complete
MIIWIASYPKSGNTWIRSLINQILFTNPNNKEKILLSMQKNIKAYPLVRHFMNLNSSFNQEEDFQKINNIIKNWKTSQDKINANKNLKFFKTHNLLTSINLEGQIYDFTNLENTLGVIYIVRDPRNVITSLKNHFFLNSYDEALEMMIDKKKWIGTSKGSIPEALSSWDQHYNSWSFFPKNYILFKYEELLSNPKKQIDRLTKYLQKFTKINIDENKLDKIISNSNFSNFKDLENQGLFNEKAVHPETKEKKSFFYLGPENDYSKLLDYKIKNKIENFFKETMIKLNYL